MREIIHLDSEPSEIENQILNLRTKLEAFKTHLLLARTPRDRKIAISRIKVLEKQIKNLILDKWKDEILLD